MNKSTCAVRGYRGRRIEYVKEERYDSPALKERQLSDLKSFVFKELLVGCTSRRSLDLCHWYSTY